MQSQPEAASSKRPDSTLYAPIIAQMIERLNAKRMLCYGGADEYFWMAFNPDKPVSIQGFRPWAEVAGAAALPSEVVMSVGYLHTVGALSIENTLDDLKRVTQTAGFFQVNLPEFIDDPVNPRAVSKPLEWWLGEFIKRFDLHTFQRVPGGFYVIVYPQLVKVKYEH